MNRMRIRRLVGVTTIAALMLAAIGAGPVAARNPTWRVTTTLLPGTVKPGNDAGYDVVIENFGTSNINRLTFSATPVQQNGKSAVSLEPTFRTGLTWAPAGRGPEVSCTSTGQLVCDLGTVPGFTTISFRVAYQVPADFTGTFHVTWARRAGTGDVEGGNNSRGDKYSVDAITSLNSSQDFDGGFVVDDFNYATGGTLGRNNKQTSSVDVSDDLITVNVQDGGVTAPTCTIAACAHLIGDWADLSVPNNDSMIKLTLMIWGGSVPGGVGADDIYLLHSNGSGGFDAIGDTDDEICADANTPPSSGECIKVTKVGSNYRLVAWLLKNGTLRGTW